MKWGNNWLKLRTFDLHRGDIVLLLGKRLM